MGCWAAKAERCQDGCRQHSIRPIVPGSWFFCSLESALTHVGRCVLLCCLPAAHFKRAWLFASACLAWYHLNMLWCAALLWCGVVCSRDPIQLPAQFSDSTKTTTVALSYLLTEAACPCFRLVVVVVVVLGQEDRRELGEDADALPNRMPIDGFLPPQIKYKSIFYCTAQVNCALMARL